MRGEPSLVVPDLVALINMAEIECWFVAGSTPKIEGGGNYLRGFGAGLSHLKFYNGFAC